MMQTQALGSTPSGGARQTPRRYSKSRVTFGKAKLTASIEATERGLFNLELGNSKRKSASDKWKELNDERKLSGVKQLEINESYRKTNQIAL